MKLIKLLLLSTLVFLANLSFAGAKDLNVYTWSNYISPTAIRKFEQQTGIKVNLSYYSSNSILYTRLKTNPKAGYDIVIPSTYYIARMIREHMLHKLNKAKLSNFKYLNKSLLNKKFDPHNRYSVPYIWGSTGIVVNDKRYNPKNIQTWQDLWSKKYRNQLMLLEDVRDIFSMSLISLGYKINDTNREHLKQAYQKLQKLMPNVRIIGTDENYMNIYTDEDAYIGTGYSGDIFAIAQENPHVHYIYPKPSFSLWIDCMAIPADAPHYQNALKFINFLMQPKIARYISTELGYATPNAAAMRLLPKKYRNSPILNPSAKILKRAQLEGDTSSTNQLLQHYWQLLKLE